MKKRKLWWALVIVSVFFTVGCPKQIDPVPENKTETPDNGNNNGGGNTTKPDDNNGGNNGGTGGGGSSTLTTLTKDETVGSEGMSNTNLSGKKVTVTEGGAVLSNLNDGTIIIGAGVGDGEVKIEGGTGLNLKVESNANIVLSSTTEIDMLVVKSNARRATITSTKAIATRAARAAGEEVLPTTGPGEPIIDVLQVEAEADVILEGGNVSDALACEDNGETAEILITKDSTATVKTLTYADAEGNKDESKNLKLSVDETYDGKGIRVNIAGKRPEALVREVYRIKEGAWMQIEWAEDASWSSDGYKVHDKTFTYEYLNADETYGLVIKYYKPLYIDANGNFSDEKILVSSDYIDVTPKNGHEFNVSMPNGSKFVVDEATGNISWKGTLPSGPYVDFILNYTVFSLDGDDWKYIGGYDSPKTGRAAFDDVNLYKSFSIYNRDKIVNDKVFVTASFKYQGFSWDITKSDEITFDDKLYPNVDVDNKNILKFTRGADKKVVPQYNGEDADGYYIWLYNGKKGSYIAYDGIPKKDTEIDLNIVIEGNSDVKKEIQDHNNMYSFDMAWYKKVQATNDDGSSRTDNQYISSFAHKDNLKYMPQEGYEAAVIKVENDKVTITPPGAKMLDEYKEIGDKMSISLWVTNENGVDQDYLWAPEHVYSEDEYNIPLASLAGHEPIDLTNRLIYSAARIKKNNGKYIVKAWVTDADGSWKLQASPDIEAKFDTKGCELPTVHIMANHIQLTKPGSRLVEMLKDTGATEYWLHIRDAKDDGKLVWFTHGINLETLVGLDGVDYTEEVNLIPRIVFGKWDLDADISNNKIWVDMSPFDITRDADGTESEYKKWWAADATGIDSIEFEVKLDGYDFPKVELAADNILNVIAPGEKYTEYTTDAGATKYVLTVRNVDWTIGEYDWSQDYTHILCQKEYPINKLPSKIDLNLLILEYNSNNSTDGKVWYDVVLDNDKEYGEAGYIGWGVISCTEIAFDKAVLADYKLLPTVTINEDGDKVTMTVPGKKLIEYYKSRGADKIVYEIFAFDDVNGEEKETLCAYSTFAFKESKETFWDIYLDPSKESVVGYIHPAPGFDDDSATNLEKAAKTLSDHYSYFRARTSAKKGIYKDDGSWEKDEMIVPDIIDVKWDGHQSLTFSTFDDEGEIITRKTQE